MGYIDTTELGKTTMAVKSLAVILFSGLAAAEASYGYGVAIHPGYGTSYTNRSPQGLSYGGYGLGYGYGKRDAEPGYGYGDMVMVDTVLHLSLPPSPIMDMVDHSLTVMDTTLDLDMERETLRPSQDMAMVPEATPT